jgi:hypothetical protein
MLWAPVTCLWETCARSTLVMTLRTVIQTWWCRARVQ